jgi:signal peptidase I
MGETKKPKTKRSFWFELPILVLVAVLVAVVVRTFLIQTFYIPSESMENTLLIDDRVLVNKVVYDMREPKRGEVVVFKPPANWHAGEGKDDYIKRVVGIGGDHIVCCDAQGRITVNGKALNEDYLFPRDKPSEREFDVTVPKGRLFVMGDHRSASADSREHEKFNEGTIGLDAVVGRAFVIFWPLNRATSLSPPETYAGVPAPRAG